MKRAAYLLLGVILAIGAGSFAATGGGFPSRPRFQVVTVSSTAPANGQLQIGSPNTGAANVSYIGFIDQVGTRTGYVGDDGGADSNTTLRSDSGAARLSTPGASLQIDNAGLGAFSGTSFTVGGSQVCRADGTNCPTAGAQFVGVMTGTDTRTSTIATSCATGLTVTLPNVTARYQYTAVLRFQGGGITANGWRVNMTGGGGTHIPRWTATATTNTVTANTSSVSNASTISSDFTALFNAAGVDTFVTITGTDSVTSPATPTLCVAWAQNTSNATASSLLDSSIVVTRLN